jgi:prepilin-type N-terminal cleavage/methylation domain-containing protein
MEMHMSNNGSQSLNGRLPQERGFSLLEVIIAMLILTIGLLGVASAVGYALMASNSGRGLTNAKLLVISSLEQMETLRDSGQLNFAEIANTSLTSTVGVFPPDFQFVSTTPGADFMYGTADDPGLTDVNFRVAGVKRKIEITNMSTTLKKIKVTLQYLPDPNGVAVKRFDLVCVSYLNDDSHGNYVP